MMIFPFLAQGSDQAAGKDLPGVVPARNTPVDRSEPIFGDVVLAGADPVPAASGRAAENHQVSADTGIKDPSGATSPAAALPSSQDIGPALADAGVPGLFSPVSAPNQPPLKHIAAGPNAAVQAAAPMPSRSASAPTADLAPGRSGGSDGPRPEAAAATSARVADAAAGARAYVGTTRSNPAAGLADASVPPMPPVSAAAVDIPIDRARRDARNGNRAAESAVPEPARVSNADRRAAVVAQAGLVAPAATSDAPGALRDTPPATGRTVSFLPGSADDVRPAPNPQSAEPQRPEPAARPTPPADREHAGTGRPAGREPAPPLRPNIAEPAAGTDIFARANAGPPGIADHAAAIDKFASAVASPRPPTDNPLANRHDIAVLRTPAGSAAATPKQGDAATWTVPDAARGTEPRRMAGLQPVPATAPANPAAPAPPMPDAPPAIAGSPLSGRAADAVPHPVDTENPGPPSAPAPAGVPDRSEPAGPVSTVEPGQRRAAGRDAGSQPHEDRRGGDTTQPSRPVPAPGPPAPITVNGPDPVSPGLLPAAGEMADRALADRVEAGVPGSFAVSEPRLAGSVAAPPPASQPVSAAQQVIQQLSDAVRGVTEGAFELALSPEELGRVRMSLQPTEAGMTISILAERADTLDLIRRHIDMLAADLRAQGFVDLDFSFARNGADPGAGDSAGPHEGEVAAVEHAADNPATAVALPRTGPGPDGLDLKL